ncbi:hypothetical protein WJX84_003222 [Apatococcus fuscideae]|uniref:Helicase C-terminal domain-containing protein n=1 Tax=Apatococcus fuscideae TaxID=2026836 RepID=A0AAW1SX96_9CHLO
MSSAREELDLFNFIYSLVLPDEWVTEQPEPAGLQPTLHAFQRRVLAWMAQREGVLQPNQINHPMLMTRASEVPQRPAGAVPAIHQLHPFWRAHPQEDGTNIYLNPFTGERSLVMPEALRLPSGGILADEVGLGKTVDVIALMLLHPPPSPSAALSGQEAAHAELGLDAADAGAVAARTQDTAANTLIVCPGGILQQWQTEIERHAPGLKLEVYGGLRWHRCLAADMDAKDKKSKRKKQVRDLWEEQRLAGQSTEVDDEDVKESQRLTLALGKANVVLTTYQVLRTEIHYGGNPERISSLRHVKRYLPPASPLLGLSWWRAVMDEAQDVGEGHSAVGQFAARLDAKHRWAVTGTPIGPHGLADIAGLLKTIAHPLGPHLPGLGTDDGQQTVASLLQPIMWRNTKLSVQSEGAGFQPKHQHLVQLQFDSPEWTFYEDAISEVRALVKDVETVEEVLAGFAATEPPKDPVQASEREQMQKKLKGQAADFNAKGRAMLRQLRLGCLHPQLTRRWRERSHELQLNAGTVSMAEVMQRMADKAGPSGGIASASVLSATRKRKAADEAQSPCSRKKGKQKSAEISAENQQALLQQALENLEKSMRVGEKGVDALSKEYDSLPNIQLPPASLRAWRLTQVDTRRQLADVYERLDKPDEAQAMRVHLEESVNDVRAAADAKLEAAQHSRERIVDRLGKAKSQNLTSWQTAVTQGWPPDLEGDAEIWQQALDSQVASAKTHEEEHRKHVMMMDGTLQLQLLGEEVTAALNAEEQGLLAARNGLEGLAGLLLQHETLACLRSFLAAFHGLPRAGRVTSGPYAGAGNGLQSIVVDPAKAGKQVDPAVACFWRAMCHTETPEAVARDASQLTVNAISYELVERLASRMLRVQEKHREKLRQQAAQYRQAAGHRLSSHASRNASLSALCSIRARVEIVRCLKELHKSELRIEMCTDDVRSVTEDLMTGNKSNARPSRLHTDPELAKVNLKGTWPTKFDALLRKILHMRALHPDEKHLVFSYYDDALKLMKGALQANSLSHVEFMGGVKAASKSTERLAKEDIAVILVAYHAGGKGLTLVQANHVHLLEPSPDPAVLIQAVGRVDRLGQTRPVHVHRYIMTGTIEEAIMEMQERRAPLFEETAPTNPRQTGLRPPQHEELGQTELRKLLMIAARPTTGPGATGQD